jgi:acid phosphatase
VVEENHSFSSVIGNPAMPYLNGLANQYGLATNYFANTHPSIGNYFMLTTGEVITNNDGYGGTVSQDNIVREFSTAGVSWKAYAESLPSVGYLGGDFYPYAKHHNPFAYFTDVRNNSVQASNLVPFFPQFSADLAAGTLPQYSFILPNLQDDAHDCPVGSTTCTDTQKLTNADNWLKTNIDPLIRSSLFQTDGLLVIVFDEAATSDKRNGGGRVAAVVISPMLQSAGYRAIASYQHASVLRLLAQGLGLSHFPGLAQFVPDMGELFGSATWNCPVPEGLPSVSLCLPQDGAQVVSPVPVFAQAFSSAPVTSMQLMVDDAMVAQSNGDRMSQTLSLSAGTHVVSVNATDTTNSNFSSSSTVTAYTK